MPSFNDNVNRDEKTISHFGEEWQRFNYSGRDGLAEDLDYQYKLYTQPLSRNILGTNCVAADFGAGSGRWAERLLPDVGQLYLVEPSLNAFKVLESKFENSEKVILLNESINKCSIPSESLDFAMSLGVLHHIPDTERALKKIFETLKPGGHFLGYLYYSFENKNVVYRFTWQISDLARKIISKSPTFIRKVTCEAIAAVVYFPLARLARIIEIFGMPFLDIPLHHYRKLPFYMMRNDALDRFGTPLEQRFSKQQIKQMLLNSGADEKSIIFSDSEPFWTFSADRVSTT